MKASCCWARWLDLSWPSWQLPLSSQKVWLAQVWVCWEHGGRDESWREPSAVPTGGECAPPPPLAGLTVVLTDCGQRTGPGRGAPCALRGVQQQQSPQALENCPMSRGQNHPTENHRSLVSKGSHLVADGVLRSPRCGAPAACSV